MKLYGEIFFNIKWRREEESKRFSAKIFMFSGSFKIWGNLPQIFQYKCISFFKGNKFPGSPLTTQKLPCFSPCLFCSAPVTNLPLLLEVPAVAEGLQLPFCLWWQTKNVHNWHTAYGHWTVFHCYKWQCNLRIGLLIVDGKSLFCHADKEDIVHKC